MNTKNILLVAGLGVAAFAAYKYFNTPTAPAGAGANANYIPPGGNYNGYVNTTNAPVWLTATGVALNAAGQVLSTLSTSGLLNGNQQGNGYWCYDCDPQGIIHVPSCPAGKQCVAA